MTSAFSNSSTIARETAQRLAQRLQADPDFQLQVERDPLCTLTTAGLPDEHVRDFLREVNLEPEVIGYLPCRGMTCQTTCAVTCFWTG
jgi:hypothetical protein